MDDIIRQAKETVSRALSPWEIFSKRETGSPEDPLIKAGDLSVFISSMAVSAGVPQTKGNPRKGQDLIVLTFPSGHSTSFSDLVANPDLLKDVLKRKYYGTIELGISRE